ncbi:diguanylate cyclase [Blastococcus sp. LR1]|uniref:GGDEF domain-containing protein n=1 Tax=Blastococcus sp. LR1 TaxID=2877000 RepID=UPI001CCE4C19|nr:GGDEF domain-containing protein [Blastococcus sp. LR1]MCA0143709.1 GGDEF domain-containing protein [Blastococcus sp. LR1]
MTSEDVPRDAPAAADPTELAQLELPEGRLAARTMAALLVVGGLMGSANLFVDGVLIAGAARWAYGATMVALLVLGVVFAVLGRVGPQHTFALVLVGDLVYLVVVLCIEDRLSYATPLMLLFPALVAGWFLELRQMCVHMVVIAAVCLGALWPSYDSGVGLGVQVVVSALTLNFASLTVFLLRWRVQRLLEATERLTRLDPLTGLFNRRYLVEQAPRIWRQARRDGTRVAAMVLDLDHFKRLNDQFGHAAGDQVLGSVARSLQATVRPADVLARTGGEELVVLGLVADAAEARQLAERLRRAVAAGRTADDHGVTASIGLAVTRPEDGEDAVAALWRLVDLADAAMYEAKRRGRDRVATAATPRTRAPRTEETSA